jgi:hypothetical protein
MSDELGFHGNELINLQTIFVVGNVVGLLPFAYLFPRVPMHVLVPTLDLGWGIFTLLQYRATSYAELMAYRFMVSIFEVSLCMVVLITTIKWTYRPHPRHHISPGSISC